MHLVERVTAETDAVRVTKSMFATAFLGVALLCGCTSESPTDGESQGDFSSSSSALPTSGSPGAPPTSSGAGTSTGNQPAFVQVARITPDPLVLNGPIRVVVEAQDPEGGPVTFRHQWVVNGQPVDGQTGSSLPPDVLQRGDRVRVDVMPLDINGQGIPFQSEEVQVVNTPPVVTGIRFDPFPAKVGDSLNVIPEAHDADDDDITYAVVWKINGKVVSADESPTLDLSNSRRGDTVAVEVTPRDDTEAGLMRTSDPIEIANSPPKITSTPPSAVDQGRYQYAVKAVDRDGDPLIFGLQDAPPGVSIDPQTGRLEWPLTPDIIKGTHRIKVTVSDGQDGEPSVQEFDLRFGGNGNQPAS